MKCTACGDDFDFEYKLDDHQAATGHIGRSQVFTPAQERRKNPPDRRTHCGRFAIYTGPGRLQVLLDPRLIFLERCSKALEDRYARIRTEIDEYMVDIAQEVAKRDGIQSSPNSTALSDGRRRICGEKI